MLQQRCRLQVTQQTHIKKKMGVVDLSAVSFLDLSVVSLLGLETKQATAFFSELLRFRLRFAETMSMIITDMDVRGRS